MSGYVLRIVAAALIAALLALLASRIEVTRRSLIQDIVRADAPPGPPPVLPAAPADAAGLAEAPFVRVVLIDGENRADALTMPAWSALCERGVDLELDVGFPTVSLPVQVSLWTGLTQQQTGVLFHSGLPLADPLGARGIPAQAAMRGGSIAIAESHPEIIGSLGFGVAKPPIDAKVKNWELAPKGAPSLCQTDQDPVADDWGGAWIGEATQAVAGPDRLAFVHVLRVDASGHKCGRGSPAWRHAEETADEILASLVAAGDLAHPDARWFLLADHGHIPAGGHGGADRSIRRVRACIAGPGIAPGKGGPIALVDFSRAIADSLGVGTAPGAKGRPLAGALAAPLHGDELVPTLSRGRLGFAALVLLLGVVVTAAALGRHSGLWAPWWWPIAIVGAMIALGSPDLSAVYVFSPKGDAIAAPARWGVYLGALWTAAAVHLAGRPLWRVALAQIAIPLACMVAALILCGGVAILWGDPTVPIGPHWTAWASVLMVISSRALWALALALLATSVLPWSGRAAAPGTRRSGS